MWQCLILGLLIGLTQAGVPNDVQFVKTVKGGYAGHQFQEGNYLNRFYGNQTQYGQGYGMRTNMTSMENVEVGVCYIEVPTASLVADSKHVPAGNGSDPQHSRIRTCCKGYIRNIHNFKLCDPVCNPECVNALCVAPDVCNCFPDHVKNLAGFCIPTCPIGCQNGQCAGGECLCNEGYRLDSEGKFCVPICRENCGGIGNCTAPNTCECRAGYQSTPEGACKPVCDKCLNGDCVAPNDCRCKSGYIKEQQLYAKGQCIPHCAQGCAPNGRCIAPNVCDFPATTTTTVIPIQVVLNSPRPPMYPENQYLNPNQTGSHQTNPIYPNQQHSNQPNYPYNSNYPNQQHSNQPNYPYQSNDPNQPNNPNQQNNPNYPYQSNYPNQHNQNRPNNPNQPSYPYQPNYPNQQNPPQPYNPNQPYYPYQPNNNQPGSQNQYYAGQNYSDIYSQVPSQDLIPQCNPTCINGICVGINRCSCDRGYVQDSTDPTGTRCIPVCAGGCVNGVCSAPNFCICNMGYFKDTSVKGRAVCVKRIRRSIDFHSQKPSLEEEPLNVAELLTFEIPFEY